MNLLLFFSLLPFNFWVQTFPVDAISGKIYFAEEVLVKDGPQMDLYNRAKAWFAASAKNKRALLVDDLANGLLIGSNYRLLSVRNGQQAQTLQLWYTVKLEMEDDRYWYSITDLQIQGGELPKVAGVKNQTNKVALEALVIPKNIAAQKGEKAIFYKSLEHAAHKSIVALIKDLKGSML